MRIKLIKGKQKEMISLAKRGYSWKELGKLLSVSSDYLRNELLKEKGLLSEEIYEKLCKIIRKRYDKYVLKKLDNNWGRSKGGLNSKGSTLKLKIPLMNKKLAELIGIILGDGNIGAYKKGKKIGVYHIKIAGDYTKDREYHLDYIKPLCEKLFNLKVKEMVYPKNNERFIVLYSLELVKFFEEIGLKAGNKIHNQSTIPKWIFKNNSFLRVCLRGLIDTDGSIFQMSKKNPTLLRINFKNHNRQLLEDTRNAFIKLGFNPSKIICNNVFYLSRQKEIGKYFKEIGFKNLKHLKRLQNLKSRGVVVKFS